MSNQETSQNMFLNVNGVSYPVSIDAGRNLLSVLRGEIGLTGTKEGCDDCECGACMVLLDGQPVNSCSYLAAQTQGREITTIEGIAPSPEQMDPLQANILEAGGVQCGLLHTGHDLVRSGPVGTQCQPIRRRSPDRTFGQPLSMYRLCQDR